MDTAQIKREVQFRADRSSGSGGQHVNKVSTKVTLTFFPEISMAFTESERSLLLSRLAGQLTADGALRVTAQASRSQARNRQEAWDKLLCMLTTALRPPAPPRKRSRRNVNAPHLRRKRTAHAEKKALRRKIRPQDIPLND
jgi:ribosome-associated protein